MLILVAVTVSYSIKSGLLTKAKEGGEKEQLEQERETLTAAVSTVYDALEGTISRTDLQTELKKSDTDWEVTGEETYIVTSPKENIFTVSSKTGKVEKDEEEQENKISFKIDGTTYYAEIGMKWEDWVNNTTYNTIGAECKYTRVYVSWSFVGDSSSTPIEQTETIVKDGEYRLISCCFDPGSQVLMADGKTKNIEDIKVGDMIMSLNEDTGKYIPQRVVKTIIRHNSDDLVYVNLSNGVKIGMRAYHPLLTTEGYKSLRPELAQTTMEVGEEVGLLKVGDTLVGYEENATIVSIEQRDAIENYDTYNLSIEGYHNYIVNGFVVHNVPCIT